VVTRFRKREQVDVDLDSIWSFIASDNVNAAHRQIDRIGDVFEMLVQIRSPVASGPISGEICAVSQSGAA
jgi:plasmid stabilization system protein ParE